MSYLSNHAGETTDQKRESKPETGRATQED